MEILDRFRQGWTESVDEYSSILHQIRKSYSVVLEDNQEAVADAATVLQSAEAALVHLQAQVDSIRDILVDKGVLSPQDALQPLPTLHGGKRKGDYDIHSNDEYRKPAIAERVIQPAISTPVKPTGDEFMDSPTLDDLGLSYLGQGLIQGHIAGSQHSTLSPQVPQLSTRFDDLRVTQSNCFSLPLLTIDEFNSLNSPSISRFFINDVISGYLSYIKLLISD